MLTPRRPRAPAPALSALLPSRSPGMPCAATTAADYLNYREIAEVD